MRYALIAILLGAALALADDEVEPVDEATTADQEVEAPGAPEVDESR